MPDYDKMRSAILAIGAALEVLHSPRECTHARRIGDLGWCSNHK